MGKLLLLSWGVYPSKGGSTFLVNNIAKGYTREELVIAGQKPVVEPVKKWEDSSDIKLYYLDPFPLGIKRFSRILYWLKIQVLINEVSQIIKRENVDRILVVFPNEFFCYIAMQVSKRSNIPFSVWFHNSYLENRSGVWELFAKWLQPRLFARAKNIFVMSEGMRSELQKIYPKEDFKVLVHGLDISHEMFSDKAAASGEHVKFLYTGSLNHACLDASLRLFRVIMANPKYELYISTGNNSVFESRGIKGDGVVFTPYLPMKEFYADLCNYDIMLLPHGLTGEFSDLEYKTIFPTRTIPLLFSRKPILAHSPTDSFLTNFLKDNRCALVVEDPSEEKIEAAIEEILRDRDLVNEVVTNATEIASQFRLENARAVIDRLV